MSWSRAISVALFASSIVTFAPSLSKADEFYTFISVQCVQQLRLFRLERFGVYNVREYVWERAPLGTPKDKWDEESWQVHVRNLKALEDQYGIYAVDQAFGLWEEAPIECDLGPAKVSISFTKESRQDLDSNGNQRFYRGRGTLQLITKSGRVAWESSLNFERIVVSYNNGFLTYKTCTGDQLCDFSDGTVVRNLD